MALIRVENICKTYHVGEIDVPVLKGVTFSIEKGELVALMGASGSGKSTLMNILGCLDRPTSGEYWLDGEEVGKLAANERALVRSVKLGFVFQSFNLLPRTSATNNVLMPIDYSPDPPSFVEGFDRACSLLTRVGLDDRLDHVPSQMSGGQQQRVAIARSLINQPALLLADEPTGNLDSKTSVEILRMFQQLNASGLTIVLVTHDPKVAEFVHRVIRVVDGLIEEDFRTDSNHPKKTNGSSPGNGHHQNGSSHSNGTNGHSTPTPARVATAVSSVALAPTPAVVATAPEPRSAAVAVVDPPPPTETAPKHKHRRPSPPLLPTTLRTAVGALRRNKMRSMLTTLGIVIGVGAVIAMVEISQGSRVALLKSMSSMGSNNLLIQSGAASSGGITFGSGSQKTLTPGDAGELAKQCPAIDSVAPVVQIQGQVVRGNRNWVPMSIYGTTPPYLRVRDWGAMSEGDMFTDRDVLASNKVCVIGTTLARELFDNESPIGQDIRVRNVSLRVVGVLGRKGANMVGMDQDDVILAPWTTIKYRVAGRNSGGASAGTDDSATANKVNSLNNLYPGSTKLYPVPSEIQAANNPQPVRFTNVDQIMVKAASAEEIPAAMSQIGALLRERHHLRPEEPDDFNIRDMSEMLKAMNSMSQMMGGLLLIVAMISLAVGGVGIMNIMLVSVTERTREIGLRMAVGARAPHILRQFLIEAIVLCVFGGFLGIMLGRLVTFIVWYILRWPIQASLPAMMAAVAVSATVGIAFGFYPAWKASRLDPIESLRHE